MEGAEAVREGARGSFRRTDRAVFEGETEAAEEAEAGEKGEAGDVGAGGDDGENNAFEGEREARDCLGDGEFEIKRGEDRSEVEGAFRTAGEEAEEEEDFGSA